MRINDILAESEYMKERSAKELREWVAQKEGELWVWCQEHSRMKALRKMKNRELDKGLPNKFAHELTPFAYYANTYYGNKPHVRFQPCCGSESYDGIIIDNCNKVFVEITNAIDGKKWALQQELLIEHGHSPWEHSIHGVKGNKTKRTRSTSDIITTDNSISHSDIIGNSRMLVRNAVLNKCKKSIEQKLPYGQKETVLIVTFDDTVLRPSNSKKDWDDFVGFKRTEIDSMDHNFKNIVLFGWLDKTFID